MHNLKSFTVKELQIINQIYINKIKDILIISPPQNKMKEEYHRICWANKI